MCRHNSGERAYLTFAYNDADDVQVDRLLRDGLCDLYAIGYKKQYLTSQLGMRPDTLLKKTLLNAMSIFDIRSDKKSVNKVLGKIKDFSLDGFYNFRLTSLKERWKELICVSLHNSAVLWDEATMREFLSFLLDTIPPLADDVTVRFFQNDFLIRDDKGRVFEKLYLLSDEKPEETLIYNLICISPQSVTILTDREMDPDWKDFMFDFFNVTFERVENSKQSPILNLRKGDDSTKTIRENNRIE